MAEILKTSRTSKGYLGGLALISVLLGLYLGLLQAPSDAYQGEVQRIMYLHIPSILTAYLSFFLVFIGSCLYSWKREKRDDLLAYSAAEIGVLFTALTINFVAFLLLYFYLLSLRVRLAEMREEIKARRME